MRAAAIRLRHSGAASSSAVARSTRREAALEPAGWGELDADQQLDRPRPSLWNGKARGQALEAITRALAPAGVENVTLPEQQVDDLEGLYESLTQPLPQPPSRDERVSRMASTNTSEQAFWRRRERTVEQHTHRVRCFAAKRDLAGAHAAFGQMEADGLRPDAAAFSALMDACAKCGDVPAAEAVLAQMRRARVRPTSPVYTSLMQAHIRAGDDPDAVVAVLGRMEREGVIIDAPAHTAVIQALAKARRFDEAWDAFDEMRFRDRQPDGVTFAIMMHVCALNDELEKANDLWMDMKHQAVAPMLGTHTSYISACASRARSLADLPKQRRRWLQKLAVDVRPSTPLEAAHRQIAALTDDGLAPDADTYVALLRAHAGAGDARGAQRTLTRMLDSGLRPVPAHFHQLLGCCLRAQRLQPLTQQAEHLAIAMSVPPSMAAAGVPVDTHALDLVIGVHAAGRRLFTTLELLETLHSSYGLPHSGHAHEYALTMCDRIHRADPGAATVLRLMEEAGVQPTDEQRSLPARIAARRDAPFSALPKLPEVAYARRRGGFVSPAEGILEETRRRWTLTRGGRAEHRKRVGATDGRGSRQMLAGDAERRGVEGARRRAMITPGQTRRPREARDDSG
jgi:pentatricopeptide repeat protein